MMDRLLAYYHMVVALGRALHNNQREVAAVGFPG